MEKRSHWNQYTKSPMEGEGQAGSIRNPRPNCKCAHNHRESKAAHPRHLAKQQKKMGTGKDSDKLGKNAVTSHKEP